MVVFRVSSSSTLPKEPTELLSLHTYYCSINSITQVNRSSSSFKVSTVHNCLECSHETASESHVNARYHTPQRLVEYTLLNHRSASRLAPLDCQGCHLASFSTSGNSLQFTSTTSHLSSLSAWPFLSTQLMDSSKLLSQAFSQCT